MKFPWDREIDESKLGPHWFARMLSSLYFSTFMIRASFAIMLIAFPIYIIGLKSYFLFGIVLASSPLFELITVLGLGAYIDKHGRKNVLLLGLLVGSLALFALLLTKDPVPLFVINAFHGMSAAAILVASLALLADYAPPEQRGRAMGAFDFTNIFGWITGFGIGGFLIDVYHDDIGMTFVIAGVLGLIAWVWAAFNVHEPHKEAHLASDISFRSIAAVLKQRSVVLLIAPWFIIYLLISTMLTFTSKAGTQELGLSGLELGLILGGGGAIFLVTQVVYGHMSDKYGRTRIMIVGTVGIVGIMLTVGAVFLTAPPVIAPAARHMFPAELDDDPYSEYLLQSDYGLYLVDDNGMLLRELPPPEGGFGEIQPFYNEPGGRTRNLILVSTDAVELFSLDSDSITWVHPVSDARLVRAADIDHDRQPEILFADATGIHVEAAAMPAGVPEPPAITAGQTVLDLAWYGEGMAGAPGILALVAEGNNLRILLVRSNSTLSFPISGGFDSFLSTGGADPLSVQGSDGVAVIDETTGNVERLYAVPEGWKAFWYSYPFVLLNGTLAPTPQLVAYGPTGGAGVFYRDIGPGGPSTELFDLPRGFAAASMTALIFGAPGDDAQFAGFASNGAFVRGNITLSNSPPTVELAPPASVLVKRETAQSTFSQLTSPAVAIPLGIFALMAGAFGPAALAGLTDVSDKDKRGTTMGLYSVVISSSMIVGPVVTGFLVDNYGGFGVMVFLVVSAAAMGLLMALRAWDVRRSGGDVRPAPKDPSKEPEASPADEPPNAG